MKVRVLVNPKAGGGRAARKVQRLEHLLKRRGVHFDVIATKYAGHATQLTHQARADSIDVLAVTGGDGTLNEVSQAYVDAEGKALPGPALAVVPAGTGGDFRKSLNQDHSVEGAVTRIVEGKPTPMDLGVLNLTAGDGSHCVRAFINITSFGLGGLADRIVNESPKWIGGRAAFLLGILRAMARYRNQQVEISVDDRPFYEGPITNVAVANGRYFGGGLQIAPEALLNDGYFDVVALTDLSHWQNLCLSPKIYRGKHLSDPNVTVTRGRVLRAQPLCQDPVLIDMDGETPGRLPLTVTVAHHALQLWS